MPSQVSRFVSMSRVMGTLEVAGSAVCYNLLRIHGLTSVPITHLSNLNATVEQLQN